MLCSVDVCCCDTCTGIHTGVISAVVCGSGFFLSFLVSSVFSHLLSVIYLCFFCSQADLSSDIEEGSGAFYGVSSQYSGAENITISVSTKVCSFGKQVVEKVEVRKSSWYFFETHEICLCVILGNVNWSFNGDT